MKKLCISLMLFSLPSIAWATKCVKVLSGDNQVSHLRRFVELGQAEIKAEREVTLMEARYRHELHRQQSNSEAGDADVVEAAANLETAKSRQQTAANAVAAFNEENQRQLNLLNEQQLQGPKKPPEVLPAPFPKLSPTNPHRTWVPGIEKSLPRGDREDLR